MMPKSETNGKVPQKKSGPFLLIFYFLSVVVSELLLRGATLDRFEGIGILFIFLFSVPVTLGCFALTTVFTPKVNRFFSVLISVLLAVLYSSQLIYNKIFHTFYTTYSMLNGAQALQFWKEALAMIGKNLSLVFLLWFPVIFICLFGKRLCSYGRVRLTATLSVILILLVSQLTAVVFTFAAGKEQFSPYDMYFKTSAIDYSVDRLGVFTSFRLDLQRYLFGANEDELDESDVPDEVGVIATTKPADKTEKDENGKNEEQDEPEIDTSPNVMNIDFQELVDNENDETIIKMHKYFSNVTPTNKNEKTGSEKGNNLILITAEAFSQYAIDKDLTPTLYKMATEGYQFKNFYTPIWGVSTSDGEYVACTGTIPKSGLWSFKTSHKNLLPFVMGNQLKKIGYSTNAYHNHTYDYYGRDLSHPNMGYIYKGVGNGLDLKRSWPESDIEMIDKTTADYINNKPFHAYYMTVSGHLNYTYNGNAMATKNKEYVKNMPYSDACKAYMACNIELDRAMELLLKRLDEAGVAENTLIAISADHYPYGLTNEEISEFAGHKVEENFELYRNAFILYRKGMKSEVIERPCSSLDILPTISNLLGLEYDSRLLMGRDMFSDSDPLIIFANRSWITDKAKYNAKTKELTPLTDEEVTEEYVKSINKLVSDKFTYSAKLLDEDYYRKVFG